MPKEAMSNKQLDKYRYMTKATFLRIRNSHYRANAKIERLERKIDDLKRKKV
ncbi:hypothetical protein KAR91_38190 [Candidatus Pacearchaeota archaeon]|nr:hypothetical protein [Candidatus Pacearchaeota archaeon]